MGEGGLVQMDEGSSALLTFIRSTLDLFTGLQLVDAS